MPIRKIIRPGTTLMVAASNASDKVKGLADYVCDGIADDVEIAAALTALPSTGGRVLLSEGTFTCAATLTLPAKSVQLVGMGTMCASIARAATRLNFTLAGAGNCINFSNDTYPQLVQGLGIYGDGAQTTYGINADGSAAFKVAKDCHITNVASSAIYTAASGYLQRYEQIYALNDIASIAINIYSILTNIIGCVVNRTNQAAADSSIIGYRTGNSQINLIGCDVEKQDIGYLIQANSKACALYGCHSENCQRPINMPSNTAYGTLISSFFSNTQMSAAYAAINIGAAVNTTILDATIIGSASDKAITIAAAVAGVTIIGGHTDDTTPITDAGASGIRVLNFRPFVNYNNGTGTIASGATTAVVAHGLSGTPAVGNIQVTLAEAGTADPGNVWVDTIGAANFTVNCRSDPGVSNLDFGWSAMVY